MKAHFVNGSKGGEVRIQRHDHSITILRGNRKTTFEYVPTPTGYRLLRKGAVFDATVDSIDGEEIAVSINDRKVWLKWVDERRQFSGRSTQGGASEREIRAVMPGRVCHVAIKPGDSVKKGDALLVLEAMKMENEVKTPGDGIVETVHIESGASVEKDTLLITLKPKEA